MSNLLEARNLKVEYTDLDGQRIRLLRGVDLFLEQGEIAAVVGESGCGKSLTVKTIMGVLPSALKITRGRITFNGTNLLELSEKEYQNMRGKAFTLVPQHPLSSLNPLFTIEQQFFDLICYQGQRGISLWSYVAPRWSRRKKRAVTEIIINALNQVRLPHPEQVIRQYPAQLSGGMCQRILIAMALFSNPKMIIADEPGTALDVTIEAQINDLLVERVQEKGTAMLYITHDLGIAKNLSHRVFVMYCGQMVEHGLAEKVFENPRHPYTIGLLNSVPRMSKEPFAEIKGILPDPKTVGEGCTFRWRCPQAEENCGQLEAACFELERGHFSACPKGRE
jgi:peptide/nickel transport system ATP-binding protein